MQPSEERGSDASGISLSAYHNASQLRADGWNRLKHNAARLAESAGRQGKIASLRAAVEDDLRVEYVDLAEASRQMASGRVLVSANFVTPYPPGFPILVPGQVVSEALIAFMTALDVKEIHGYRPELGLRLFTEQALAAASATLP
jgi:arginine decarboxylase